jgi:gliding motility-associated lipoprotein GldB
MLRQFSMIISPRLAIIFYIAVFIVSCQSDHNKPDVSDIQVNVRAERLENDVAVNFQNIRFLSSKYRSFFELYTYQLLKIGTPDTVLLKSRLSDFVHDPDITNIYSDTKKLYADFSGIDAQMEEAFRYYKFYFPEKVVPAVITYISGFNYAVVCADSALGIGLDMYLGSDSKYYPSLQMPEYKIRKMQRAYIPADAMRGWAQSEWDQDPAQTDLISQVVYLGKVQYFLDRMLPDTPDSIRFGYTQKQLQWCMASEKSIWSFLVDNKLLFSTEASLTGKYVNDGPTTNGFPKESPGNIGSWLGFQIVKSYMEKHSGISLAQLMAENDCRKIFRDSNYKPAK